MDDPSLWGLFVGSLLSATLLPGGSEALLFYLGQNPAQPLPLLWLVATAGNSLGGLSGWLLGWTIAWRRPGRGLTRPEHRRALARVARHGAPTLLLAWLPLVGDPLCVAAGWAGIRPLPAALYITLGKGARYAAVLVFTG